MGGRGARFGRNKNGDYGSEYKCVAQMSNVKILKSKTGSNNAPTDTMTKGRVYATLDKQNDIKWITFYDYTGKRYLQIDIKGKDHNGLGLPHRHHGYNHDEYGIPDNRLTDAQNRKIDEILNFWGRRRKMLGL